MLERSRKAGVTGWIQGGVDPADWQRQRALAARVPGVHPTFGLHPWWVAGADDGAVDRALEELAGALGDAIALGELGLDKHPKRVGSLARQARAFEAQLALAKQGRRPLVLHVVRAHDEVLSSLEAAGPFPSGGLVHSFSGRAAEGLRYIELGFHLSLSGGRVAMEARTPELCRLPVERILVETDAPDQLPIGWTPALNEPQNLPKIADALAPAWGMTGAALLDGSRQRLEALLRISA